MPKTKPYFYLVEKLTKEKADILHRSLRIVAGIEDLNVSVGRSMVELTALRDVEDEVRLACDVAKVVYRTRAKL